MVIDVKLSEIISLFWRCLRNGKEFSGETFCIAFRKIFCNFYNKFYTNHSPLK